MPLERLSPPRRRRRTSSPSNGSSNCSDRHHSPSATSPTHRPEVKRLTVAALEIRHRSRSYAHGIAQQRRPPATTATQDIVTEPWRLETIGGHTPILEQRASVDGNGFDYQGLDPHSAFYRTHQTSAEMQIAKIAHMGDESHRRQLVRVHRRIQATPLLAGTLRKQRQIDTLCFDRQYRVATAAQRCQEKIGTCSAYAQRDVITFANQPAIHRAGTIEEIDSGRRRIRRHANMQRRREHTMRRRLEAWHRH